jgi:hypothetical protein
VNRYMTALTHVLHAHRGILDKYTGDGLMALFRDDALAATALVGEDERRRALVTQAVQAALDMQAAVQNLSRERAAENLPALGVGIGLHFGEAVVGLVGNPVHIINYTRSATRSWLPRDSRAWPGRARSWSAKPFTRSWRAGSRSRRATRYRSRVCPFPFALTAFLAATPTKEQS